MVRKHRRVHVCGILWPGLCEHLVNQKVESETKTRGGYILYSAPSGLSPSSKIAPSSGDQEFNHMSLFQNVSQSIITLGLITQIT